MPYYDQYCSCNPCQCGCSCQNSVSATPGQPAYICANGWMNDYARCVLSQYDQLSYDLDSQPNHCCRFPCGSGAMGNRFPCCPNPCIYNSRNYLNAVSEAAQTVAANTAVPFVTDRFSGGNCIQHTAGTTAFTLNCPGVYMVQYHANATITAGTDVVVSLALTSSGVTVPGSLSSATIGAAAEVVSLNGSSIITVPCGTTSSVSLTNTSVGEISVTNANMIIIRIA